MKTNIYVPGKLERKKGTKVIFKTKGKNELDKYAKTIQAIKSIFEEKWDKSSCPCFFFK